VAWGVGGGGAEAGTGAHGVPSALLAGRPPWRGKLRMMARPPCGATLHPSCSPPRSAGSTPWRCTATRAGSTRRWGAVYASCVSRHARVYVAVYGLPAEERRCPPPTPTPSQPPAPLPPSFPPQVKWALKHGVRIVPLLAKDLVGWGGLPRAASTPCVLRPLLRWRHDLDATQHSPPHHVCLSPVTPSPYPPGRLAALLRAPGESRGQERLGAERGRQELPHAHVPPAAAVLREGCVWGQGGRRTQLVVYSS
jgi:hypothetical protein